MIIMKDLLGNEIHIGDKVVYCRKRTKTKDLDYGIVTNFTENGNKCYCDSIIREYDSISLREERQIIKIG